MDFHDVMHAIVRIFEVLGVAILALGTAAAFVKAFRAANRRDGTDIGQGLRRDIGRAILLGLEVLIIGDIVRTIIVDPTLESVAVLGLIVVIRIVLSFSLEIEMDGTWPWSRWRNSSTPPPS